MNLNERARRQQTAVYEILAERDRQDSIWGPVEKLPRDRTPERWLAILHEESGELAKAVVEEGLDRRGDFAEQIRKELIETAAVALSWLEWLDMQEARATERYGR